MVYFVYIYIRYIWTRFVSLTLHLNHDHLPPLRMHHPCSQGGQHHLRVTWCANGKRSAWNVEKFIFSGGNPIFIMSISWRLEAMNPGNFYLLKNWNLQMYKTWTMFLPLGTNFIANPSSSPKVKCLCHLLPQRSVTWWKRLLWGKMRWFYGLRNMRNLMGWWVPS